MNQPAPFKKLMEKIKTGNPDDAPDEFVRDVHAAWKKEGGTLAGKPRHSDRFLFDQLRERGAVVKSLTPKLTGKTRIRPKDGATLLHYFLAQWPFPAKDGAKGQAGSEDDLTYRPLLSTSDIDAIAEYVSKQLSADDAAHEETSPSGAVVESLPGRLSSDLIVELTEQSECLITVSSENSLIVATPRTELIGFRSLMNRFWAIEKEDGKPRPLIWVLDLGRQDFEDVNARAAYMNVQALMTRFKALRDFPERQSKERWEWLKSRVSIVLLDTRHEEEITRSKRPYFLAHHVNLTAVAPLWLSLPRFRGLYGSNLERLDDRSFSVFYNSAEWEKAPETDNEVRYVGHALFYLGPKEKNERQLRGIELPTPGQNYDEAFKTVYAAAMHKLDLPLSELAELPNTGVTAIEQLNYLGYLVLRLEDFLKNY